MKLAELFDSDVEKLKWNKSEKKWFTTFIIEDIPFQMFIVQDELPNDSSKLGWEVGFGVDSFKLRRLLSKTKNPKLEKIKDKRWVDNTHGVLGTGNQGKVFSTALAALKEFAKSVNPEYIFFSAEEPSRIKLYRRMSKTLAGQIGMKLAFDESGQFVLQRK